MSSATRVRNPIKAARKVLGDDRFVLLTADGADDFAEDAGLVMEGPDYFIAEWRWDLHTEHMPAELAAQKQRQQQQRRDSQHMPPLAAVISGAADKIFSHNARETFFPPDALDDTSDSTGLLIAILIPVADGAGAPRSLDGFIYDD